jgi:hypothetical protein
MALLPRNGPDSGHCGAASRALIRIFSKYFNVAKYPLIDDLIGFSLYLAENKSI